MIEQHKPDAPVSQLHALELPPEQPIDVGRYANALRRSKLLIVAIVVVVTGLVLLMSLALPKSYSAKATILFDEGQTLATTTDAERQLATIEASRHARRVASARRPREVGRLARAPRDVGRPTANIVTIAASAKTPERAACTATSSRRVPHASAAELARTSRRRSGSGDDRGTQGHAGELRRSRSSERP
jgi:hypothetical protein